MTYQGYSNTSSTRAANTTIAQHIRQEEDAFMRNFPLAAQLRSSGRIKYKQSGRGIDWPVRYRIHDVEGNTGETQRSFVQKNLWKKAFLEFRGFQATDAMYRKEFKENRGKEGIVKVFDDLVTRLRESIRETLGTLIYIDGSLAANSKLWHGFESMFAINGTVNSGDGTQRAANAADFVGYPSDTYAGISTAPGNYGGANSGGDVWPEGIADPEFDFWAPLVVNYTCSGFNGAADTWAAQGDEALRYAIIHSQRNAGSASQVDTACLARDLYRAFLNLIDGKEQIQITSENSLRALGFKNVVVFDGVEVTWDSGVGSGIGYGYAVENTEMRSMDDDFTEVDGPEYDIGSQSYQVAVASLSNLKFKSPRNFFKLAPLA